MRIIFTSSTLNSLRAMAIARPVAAAAAAAEGLFVAGGQRLLHEVPRLALRATVERAAKEVAGTTAPGLAAQAARIAIGEAQAAPPLAVVAPAFSGRALARGASRALVRGAAKQVASSMGRAAGVGAAVDGAFAAVRAVGLVRQGVIDRKAAVTMVAAESATGAAASALAVGAVAAVVAVTGPIGFSAALLVAGATAAGSKLALDGALTRLGVPTGASLTPA